MATFTVGTWGYYNLTFRSHVVDASHFIITGGIKCTGSTGAGCTAAELANSIAEITRFWIIESLLTTDIGLEAVDVEFGPDGFAADGAGGYVATPTIDGTELAPSMPFSLATLVRHQTSTPGRTGKGRSYWMGLGQAVQENGMILDAAFAAIQTQFTGFYANIHNDMIGGGTLPNATFWAHAGVRVSGNVAPFPRQLIGLYETNFVDQVIRSQRRRQPFVGS